MPADKPTPGEPRFARRLLRRLARGVEAGLALVGLAAIVYWTGFDITRMVSGSMAPTLDGKNYRNGDLVLSERISYCFRTPRRWEVIVFRSPEGNLVMKRVVGLPGEQVTMTREGTIHINGRPLSRPKKLDGIHYLRFGNLMWRVPFPCENGYYVLGDDSKDSDDSRFNGPVKPEQVLGRAWIILSPAGRRGFVNP